MDAKYDELVKRVQALLRLSKDGGATTAEAALAASKAQELILRYNLTLYDMQSQDWNAGLRMPIFEQKMVLESGGLVLLYCNMAPAMMCKAWRQENTVYVVGREHDIALLGTVFAWVSEQLSEEFDSFITREEIRVFLRGKGFAPYERKNLVDSWWQGAVGEVRKRLNNQANESAYRAIMVRSRDDIATYLNARGVHLVNKIGKVRSVDAYGSGAAAGRRANLSQKPLALPGH